MLIGMMFPGICADLFIGYGGRIYTSINQICGCTRPGLLWKEERLNFEEKYHCMKYKIDVGKNPGKFHPVKMVR